MIHAANQWSSSVSRASNKKLKEKGSLNSLMQIKGSAAMPRKHCSLAIITVRWHFSENISSLENNILSGSVWQALSILPCSRGPQQQTSPGVS